MIERIDYGEKTASSSIIPRVVVLISIVTFQLVSEAPMVDQILHVLQVRCNFDQFHFSNSTQRYKKNQLILRILSFLIAIHSLPRRRSIVWVRVQRNQGNYLIIFIVIEDEIKRVFKDLIVADRGRIRSAISVHSYDQQWLSPYGYSFAYPPEYAEMVNLWRISNLGKENNNLYLFSSQFRVMEIGVNALTATYGTQYTYGSFANALCKSIFQRYSLHILFYQLFDVNKFLLRLFALFLRSRIRCYHWLLLRRRRNTPLLHDWASWPRHLCICFATWSNCSYSHWNMEWNQGLRQRHINIRLINCVVITFRTGSSNDSTTRYGNIFSSNENMGLYHVVCNSQWIRRTIFHYNMEGNIGIAFNGLKFVTLTIWVDLVWFNLQSCLLVTGLIPTGHQKLHLFVSTYGLYR